MKKTINAMIRTPFSVFILLILVVSGCKKDSTLVDIPSQAHFAGKSAGNYFITGTTVTYKISIGLTDVSTKDRVISFTVTSPTGAVAGTHYNIVGGNSITIPAGKALDSITVAGVYNRYLAGRKDTLVFTITDGTETKASTYNPSFKLFMRGPCSESETVLSDLLGSYTNTNEFLTGPYGPYETTITSVTPLTATTGTIVVENVFDYGWNPITFKLDWTDPLNTKVTLVEQSGIGDAGTLDGSFSGMDISVAPFAGEPGTFTWCNQRLTLKMDVGVTGLGYFGILYTVNMER
jgi:hypothetical protein